MGDMADFFLEQVMEFEEYRFLYHAGEMEAGEAYDLGIIDELGFEARRGGTPLRGAAWHRANNQACEDAVSALGAAILRMQK